jgi:hypothetical protein
MGPVEKAIRGFIHEGDILTTPAQGAPFVVGSIDNRGVVLLLGRQRTETRFSWLVLEGTRSEFDHHSWIVIGGRHDVKGNPGTLDGYLKLHIKRNTAAWVASLFEAAGVLEIDRGRPARVRVLA